MFARALRQSICLILLSVNLVASSAEANEPLEIIEVLSRPLESNCKSVSNDPDRIICICNETICDTFSNQWPLRKDEAILIETTRSGLRLKATSLQVNPNVEIDKSLSEINVDLNSEKQTILGFGGAFTDAASININTLTKPVATKLLESLFGRNGLQYSLGRVPIAGSDFSTRPYSYDDTDFRDYTLSKWQLAPEDIEHKIPIIKQAMDLVRSNDGQDLKLIASPWSPPVWMKTSGKFHRGHLIDDDRVYQAYANYLVRFFEAYEEQGVRFWGATVQNEPMASYLLFYFFNSLQLNQRETKKLIVDYLGPALEAKGYTKENFKLMVGDDSLLFVNQYASSLLHDNAVQKYVSGLAFHWYTSGLLAPYSVLSKLAEQVKDEVEFIMMTEACNGAMTLLAKHVDLGSWDRAEAYAVDIIEDMRRHTNAWIDWNLALNQEGGPNWAGNYVDSPIIVNKDKNEFYKQPMYYVLAHFSRFFRPNSVHVESELKNPAFFEKIMILAAHNKETSHVIVNILNKSTYVRKLHLRIILKGSGKQAIQIGPFNVEGKSINTVVVKI